MHELDHTEIPSFGLYLLDDVAVGAYAIVLNTVKNIATVSIYSKTL
jgi:hypothetical protein